MLNNKRKSNREEGVVVVEVVFIAVSVMMMVEVVVVVVIMADEVVVAAAAVVAGALVAVHASLQHLDQQTPAGVGKSTLSIPLLSNRIPIDATGGEGVGSSVNLSIGC